MKKSQVNDKLLERDLIMVNKNSVWYDKTNRSKIAISHTHEMAVLHTPLIKNAIKNTKLYENTVVSNPDMDLITHTNIIIDATDSVTAIKKYMKPYKRMAVLNFASYKHPGGMFMQGSQAQEECLCHASFLYNVLKEKVAYYEWNKKHLNKSLYTNRALYTPNVLFDEKYLCDVITCAAPNKRTYMQHNTDEDYNSKMLDSRIKFILDIAKYNKVNILILGAVGCGVFGQDPTEVATIFTKYLSTTEYKCFDTIVFAIPSDKNKNNYNKFVEYCHN